MLFNLKKRKGSTIVEVLVSIIIIGIVSVYGLSSFASAYKRALDSKEYSFVLRDLVRKMEMVIAGPYPGDVIAVKDEDYYPSPINSMNDKTQYDFKVDKMLRNNCKVHYTCKVYKDSGKVNGHNENFNNSTQIVLEASWPWNKNETSFPDSQLPNKKTITLVTYRARIWNE